MLTCVFLKYSFGVVGVPITIVSAHFGVVRVPITIVSAHFVVVRVPITNVCTLWSGQSPYHHCVHTLEWSESLSPLCTHFGVVRVPITIVSAHL